MSFENLSNALKETSVDSYFAKNSMGSCVVRLTASRNGVFIPELSYSLHLLVGRDKERYVVMCLDMGQEKEGRLEELSFILKSLCSGFFDEIRNMDLYKMVDQNSFKVSMNYFELWGLFNQIRRKSFYRKVNEYLNPLRSEVSVALENFNDRVVFGRIKMVAELGEYREYGDGSNSFDFNNNVVNEAL